MLLAFHRAANCPLCNLRLWRLIKRYPLYQEQGLAVLAFFESTPDYAHAYLDRLRPPFPLVADLGLQVYSRYRLESSWLRARLTRGVAYREATRRRQGGRPKTKSLATPQQIAMLQALYADKSNSIEQICATLHISRATLYRYVKPTS